MDKGKAEKPASSEKKSSGKKKKIIIITAAVLIAAIAVGFAVYNAVGPQRTVRSTLEGFFTRLYVDTLINQMTPYLVEPIREQCFNDFTLYGYSAEILFAYRDEKIALVGDDMSLSVSIEKEQAGSATALKNASADYGASALMDVTFVITFTGSKGSADFEGIARVAKVSGKWYLAEYNIPLTQV